MSETPNFNSGYNTETSLSSVESKKTAKEKGKTATTDGRRLAVSVLGGGRAEKPQEPTAEKEVPKQTTEVILGKLFGKEDGAGREAQSKEQVEKAPEVAAEPFVESEVEKEATDEVFTAQLERSVAEDLHGGEEISLREISQIPPERDENVIEEALEISVEEAPEMPGTTAETAEADGETEGLPVPDMPEAVPQVVEQDNEAPAQTPPTAEAAPATPVIPPPRIPRTRFRSGSYGMPPIGNSPSGADLPPNPPEYSMPYSAQQPNTNIAPLPTRRTIENAEWDGFQEGRRKGLVAGLLVGGGIEHFRHKRREKKMEKRQQKEKLVQQKRIERLEHDYEIAKQSQQSEQARSETSLARERLATTAERTERAKEIEELKRTQERLTQQTNETRPPEEELLPAVPKGHRIERSAWHNIEVDEHGKAVQESAIEYGREYYKERVHEVAPKQQVDSAAGEVALVAAALSESGGHSGVSTPNSQPQPAATTVEAQKPQGYSLRGGAQTVLKTVTTPPSTPLATVVWLIILVVIAIVVFTVAH